MIEPTIQTSKEKKLIGMRRIISFSEYSVGGLWRDFTLRKKEIVNGLTKELISMSVYKPMFFTNFEPENSFEKWAAIEVSNFDIVPEGMENFVIPTGLYAVFTYRGLSTDHSIFEYILRDWLPNSSYRLADRPHFEVLGEKYKNNDPNSEEEIWIPITQK